MNNDKTAIVIGAGIGGITTAIYLARSGYKVNIYEKNALPGGRCGQIIRDGHRFDIGATIFLMPEIYRKVFKTLGLNLETSLATTPLTDLYKIYYPDGTVITFTTDNNVLKEQLEAIEKGSYAKSQKLIKEGYAFFQLALERLIGRNFYYLFEFVTPKNALMLMKLKTYIRHVRYIRRFFSHPHLQKAFTFQNIYVGQDPYKASALFSMIPATELTEGSLFPSGGMFSITEKLVEVAKDLGVQFHFNTAVLKIDTEGKRARNVVLEDRSKASADVVIANADLPYVYREMLPDSFCSRWISRLKYTCSAIVFHWGLDKTYTQLGHHSVFLSAEYRNNLKKVFRDHSLSRNPSFYIHAPVRSDPTAAPSGHDTLSAIIPCGHLDEKDDNKWNELKKSTRTYIFKRLKDLGFADLEEHIKFEICYTPQTWKSIYNLSRGATFGSLGHNILQMGYFRPHNKHGKYRNLYFVGGSTHPGNGIPLVLLSAKLTSERILNETNNE
jgi:phytoene desaturase